MLKHQQSGDKISYKGNKKKKYYELTPLWVGVFADIIGFTIFIPLLPAFTKAFGATNLELGLLLSSNALFSAIFGPILSKMSDKYGRKPLLLISQIGTFIGFMIFAFSNSMEMLFVSRIIDGVFGGNFPIAKAIISDVVHPKDRSVQMTNVGVAHNIANLFGPALGGILAKQFGIIGPGFASASLSLVSICSTIFWLEETAPVKIGKVLAFEKYGVASNISKETVTTVATANPININNMNGDGKAKVEGIVSGENIKTDVRAAANNKPNIIEAGNSKSLKSNRTAIFLLMQWGFHTFAFVIILSGMALFAYLKLGVDEQGIGIILSFAGAFQLFVRFVIFKPMLKRLGEKLQSRIGLFLFIFVYFIIGFVRNPVELIIIMLFMSFAASSVRGILSGFISRSVSPKIVGKVMGYQSALDDLGRIIGPLISTTILTIWSYNYYGFISALLSIWAFLFMFAPLHFYQYKKEYNLNNSQIRS
ncbi:MAG: MFS transporter [Promethearchaeota archaeon]